MVFTKFRNFFLEISITTLWLIQSFLSLLCLVFLLQHEREIIDLDLLN